MSAFSHRIRVCALLGSAVAMLGTALVASTASAQTVKNPDNSSNPGDLSDSTVEDIVVTAERRATNLQSTPLSILAVTQETVQAKGIQDLQDLSHFSPNLSISPSRAGGNTAANFVIRGISGGGGATGERGVGLYIDGVYMPRTSGAV
ncbi:MAG: TonB-dependent receptor plug domain-containing protein, partial [Sphingomonas sp.]